MMQTFEKYKYDCFGIIRDLLVHKDKSIVDSYVFMAKNAQTSNELSRIMVEVRHEI